MEECYCIACEGNRSKLCVSVYLCMYSATSQSRQLVKCTMSDGLLENSSAVGY